MQHLNYSNLLSVIRYADVWLVELELYKYYMYNTVKMTGISLMVLQERICKQ